ncbi:intercellular trafficking and secretion [Apophysomyces sp. BC1034]|nr:intercellular trafficking and secretion [Apophysomyces sp. BC1021]KAG0193972.1 intercellular trafficking and secretion [Apophysomyces sp. BC1034]
MSVRRRFQDFVWLYNVLYTHYPACFVPPLPDKHRMEYVKGDRFGTDFIEKRRLSLGRFLQRIARHPILGRAEFFLMFLESSEFNDASARALREGQETIIDTIGDSLLNAFAKIRKPDERFVEMKGRIDRLEENLELLEKTLMRTNKRTDDLCRDYDDFAVSVRGLAQLEKSLEEPLSKFAAGVDQYSSNMRAMLTHDSNWLGEIHDYMAYYNVLKGVLKLRDQKQLDFEELTDYLQSTIKEREKTLHPRSGDKSYNIAGYFTGKINEARGADMDKIKREKVLRLDERIRELQSAIKQTHDVSVAFSSQVAKEDDFFTRSKEIEMREALKSYTDGKVNFYQEGIHLWREVVQALEQLNPEDY